MKLSDQLNNKLLLRQIQRKYGSIDSIPDDMKELFITICNTYNAHEREREMIERSFDISSKEMIETNNKLAQQTDKLIRSNRELNEFAYAVSHDLKEPLRTIASYIQLIQIRLKENLDYETSEFMNFSVAGVKHMQQMLEAMLRYAQVGGEQKDFSRQKISTVIKEVKQILRKQIADSNAQIILVNELPELLGNSTQLELLFQNLFSNAIKFKGHEPLQITIDCTQQEGSYLFKVQDNGTGISEKNKQQFFMMFKRGDHRNTDSTGMGLTICKKIVENHGGKIWIDEECEKGVTIFFTLLSD